MVGRCREGDEMRCEARAKGESREWAETGKKAVGLIRRHRDEHELVRLLTGLGPGWLGLDIGVGLRGRPTSHPCRQRGR